MITIDLDRVKKAAAMMKSNPPSHDDILKDPKSFLAAQGVQIDDEVEKLITSRKNVASAPRQAAAIHIDI
ncbi:hypothetical protein [Lichenibacterium dinghuense]|uniref:hypothetical protein n=1 Tax=Lichenibacterium dinghuense TaxID=2895977 RepID=UPI001F1C765B|nr:hypothetical protein [Lichenibacterium sp. 6Y81]